MGGTQVIRDEAADDAPGIDRTAAAPRRDWPLWAALVVCIALVVAIPVRQLVEERQRPHVGDTHHVVFEVDRHCGAASGTFDGLIVKGEHDRLYDWPSPTVAGTVELTEVGLLTSSGERVEGVFTADEGDLDFDVRGGTEGKHFFDASCRIRA